MRCTIKTCIKKKSIKITSHNNLLFAPCFGIDVNGDVAITICDVNLAVQSVDEVDVRSDSDDAISTLASLESCVSA